VSDPEIRRKIINASNGNCPFMYSNTGSEGLKVYHAKSCGRTEEERKKRNGSKCSIPGLQGGSVDARCINGCCVGINVKYDVSKFVGSNSSVPGTTGSGAPMMGGTQQNSLFGSMFQMLGQMFGGGDGSGDSSYDPYSYNYNNSYDSVFDTDNNDEDLLNNLNEQYLDEPVTSYTDETMEDAVTETQGTEAHNSNLNEMNTIIIKDGDKLIKIDKTSAVDNRYSFIHQDTFALAQEYNNYNESPEARGLTDEILLNESKAPSYYQQEKPELQNDPSATGFKGEKIGQVRRLSLFERLSIWLATVFGLR